jgi:Uma2 family endonuclease
MIMAAVRTMLTIQEFLELPELDAGKRELLRGELIELPPAKDKHNELAHRFFEWLKAALAAAGIGGKVRMEKGYVLGPRHWLQPDVSITHPNQPGRDYLEGSPSVSDRDRLRGEHAETHRH